jgi:hypothetical protein
MSFFLFLANETDEENIAAKKVITVAKAAKPKKIVKKVFFQE